MPIEPAFSIFAAALVGLQFGSFLNVLVWRLPRMLEREWRKASNAVDPMGEAVFNLSTPRSHCPHCQTPLAWHDLIPVLSYLWLRGRCAHCANPISARYPLVEVVVALVWGAAALVDRLGIPRLALWIVITFAVVGLTVAGRWQAWHWRDSESLWRYTLSVTDDNAYAHANLASVLAQQGEPVQPFWGALTSTSTPQARISTQSAPDAMQSRTNSPPTS